MHDKGAGESSLVAVDLDLLIVDQRVAGVGDVLCGEDVLDAQQVEQRRVQRGHIRQGGNAVEQQLVLFLDAFHELHVLLGDDGIVAPHVVEAVEHAGVGVEGLLVGGDEGGKPPQVVVLAQKLHHRRRELQQLGVSSGVEAEAEEPEVEQDQSDGRRDEKREA